MNVAFATATAQKPIVFMAARNGESVEKGADTRTPSSSYKDAADKEAPLVGRYPTIAFSYDTDAARLVMLFRDPLDGSTVSQIPTEAALKQYKEAQQARKAGRSSQGLLVGGDESKGGGAAVTGTLTPGKFASPSPDASGTPASVVSSSPATTTAAPTGNTGTGHVNVVI